MLGGDFPKRRARCTTARSSAARFTARPRLTRPRSCMRKESSFTRCPCCRTRGTDRGLRALGLGQCITCAFSMLELPSRHPSARTAPRPKRRGRIPDICRSYHWHKNHRSCECGRPYARLAWLVDLEREGANNETSLAPG